MPYRRKKLTFAISSPDEFLYVYTMMSPGASKAVSEYQQQPHHHQHKFGRAGTSRITGQLKRSMFTGSMRDAQRRYFG